MKTEDVKISSDHTGQLKLRNPSVFLVLIFLLFQIFGSSVECQLPLHLLVSRATSVAEYSQVHLVQILIASLADSWFVHFMWFFESFIGFVTRVTFEKVRCFSVFSFDMIFQSID